MLKEIYEQPKSILDTMRGRVDFMTKEVKLEVFLIMNKKL